MPQKPAEKPYRPLFERPGIEGFAQRIPPARLISFRVTGNPSITGQ
jgi:hypothetical protein